jgi:integrase
VVAKLSKIADEKVRTAWVKKWTEKFLQGLQGLATKDRIEAHCLEQKSAFEVEVQRLSKERAEKQKKELAETSWMNAAATHMSQIRNAIKAWQSAITLDESNSYPQNTKEGVVRQHYALLYMNYSPDMHEARRKPTEDKKTEQRRNLTPIKCVDEYIAVTEKLLKSTDYRELAVGLIAATGRRMSEILSTGSFIPVRQFEATFGGQLKNKGRTGKYPAFTIVASVKVADGIDRLRRMPEIKEMRKWNLAEVDSGKNNTLNRYVKQHFEELIEPPHGEEKLSSKNLRAAYAAIAIHLFCPSNHSESLFIKERLGHTSDSTASNYEDYQVVDINGRLQSRGAWVERIGEKMLEREQRVEQVRIRMTVTTKKLIDNKDFLPYPDQTSRLEELVRLAQIGKQYEQGELGIREVVKVVEVEKPIQVVKEVKSKVSEVEETEIVKEVEVKPEVKEVEPRNRFEEMSNEELRGCQAPGSAFEKIRRSVAAIKAYNGTQAEKKMMWAINTSVLEDLSGCHSKAVRDYIDSDEGRLNVTDYNLEKGFGYQQNRGKGKVADYIRW